jgi:hypothetical protein
MSEITNGQYDYEDCVNCDGSVTINPLPHPIFTDGQGVAIVQTTAVTLGGMNGLNS